jgi:hypothetical protein
MARQPRPGLLRGRVHFQSRTMEPDPWGGDPRPGDFATVFTCAAEFIPLRGSEAVIASRLQGIQPYVVRVRQSAATRAVGVDWRIVDARAPQPPDKKARVFAWLDLLVQEGGVE